ncbi:MAG: hypothetical protein GY702_00945 [Desulfobulbaceae bacterium]|nr:hypothetical protein [Desulfobulbaceae bacterium]
MRNRSILYLFLFFIYSASLPAIAQLPEEHRLHEIEQEQVEINQMLSEDLSPEEKGHLEQKMEDLLAERRELEEYIRGKREEENRTDPSGENGKKPLLDPVVIAAIIGAIGVITAALISLKKKYRS